ncbi:MAG: ATP synthase delta chain [Ktedonobacterales bacterium]|nr:MAG: ATP synthase delta chain [Ktedonobacterales bacterium]
MSGKTATARHYAEAVFEIGVEAEKLDQWRDDLHRIAEYYGNHRLLFVLREPKIAFQRKEAIVRDLLGSQVQPEALNLALLLVERDIADIAPALSKQFDARYNDYKGVAVAQVTTAIPLDDTLRAQIASQLAQITGKRIQLEERVDPAILGGAIARVGDTLIDGSLKRRFNLLRTQIASGALGGPDDGTLAAILGPDGGGSGGFDLGPLPGGPDASAPDASAGGPSSATDMAPRSNTSAHMAPKTQSSASQTGGGNGRRNDRQNNKRRRR